MEKLDPQGKVIAGMGIGITILALFIIHFLCLLYPDNSTYRLFGFIHLDISPQERAILLIVTCGFIGSLIHMITSFTDYVGAGKIKLNWLWWYLLRPFTGAFLALAVFFLLKNETASLGKGNFDQQMGIAILSGLFSKITLQKLEELLRQLLKVKNNTTETLNTDTVVVPQENKPKNEAP
jgi:hypothetical protein